jgi:hypothetical protein
MPFLRGGDLFREIYSSGGLWIKELGTFDD